MSGGNGMMPGGFGVVAPGTLGAGGVPQLAPGTPPAGGVLGPTMGGGGPMVGSPGAGGPAPVVGSPGAGAGPMVGSPGAGNVFQGLPPQLLQMLQSRMAGGQGAQPTPGGTPGIPMGSTPPPSQAPTVGSPGAGGQPQPMPAPMAAAQVAQHGRFGDRIAAHLSPGEIQIPPEMQTPQLMQQIQHAFARLGLSPQQFTAGSQQASRNPATGLPEYSILGALLPILGAVGGSLIAPGIGTAIGGALGGAGAGMMDHQGALGTLLSAAGGGLGGYLAAPGAAGAALQGPLESGATLDTVANTSPFGGGAGLMKAGMGAGLGSAVGGMLAPPPQPDPMSQFNKAAPKLGPVNPNFNQLLGNNQSSQFSANGYDPTKVAQGQPYNFYSPFGNGSF